MIFRASEPSAPRGDKPNREIILALLAMSFLVAVMIRYSRSLWCEDLPRLCLPDRVSEEVPAAPGARPDGSRPGSVAPGSRGISGSGSDAISDMPDAIDLAAPGMLGDGPTPLGAEPTPRPSPTVQRERPATATERPRAFATELATRPSAGSSGARDGSPTPDADDAAGFDTPAPSATDDPGDGSGDDAYPRPETTRFPTRTPSPTPEGYPGP